MKATKFALAGALVLGTVSFAAAQGTGSGGSGGNSGGAEGRNTPGQSDARPAPGEQKTPANTRTGGDSGSAMQQNNTGLTTGSTSGAKQDGNAGPNSPSAGTTK
jgi:hypothetical protein